MSKLAHSNGPTMDEIEMKRLSEEAVAGAAPDGFAKLPDGVRCRCLQMWRQPDGSLWCCQGSRAGSTGTPPNDDARRLIVARRLYERFVSDLLHDAAQAKSRLIAGIQIAMEDERAGL